MGRRLNKIKSYFSRKPKRLKPGEAFSDYDANRMLGIPDYLAKAMADAGIRGNDNSIYLNQKLLPTRLDVFKQASNWEAVREDNLRLVIGNDSYLLNVFRILPNEIFKGMIRWEPAYGCKCPICDYTSDKEEEECPECQKKLEELEEQLHQTPQLAMNGGSVVAQPIQMDDVQINIEDEPEQVVDPKVQSEYDKLKADIEANPLVYPDQNVKKKWQDGLKSVNCFGHSFEKAWRTYDREIHKFDNGAMLAWKKHEFGKTLQPKKDAEKNPDGSLVNPSHVGYLHKKAYVPIEAENKFTRLDSNKVEFNLDNKGYIADQYFCVKNEHRHIAQPKEDAKYTGFCQEKDPATGKKCQRELLRAYYRVQTDEGFIYYTNKEIMHNSFYNPTDTKGISPAWSIQPLLEAKFGANMELKLRFADKQHPPYILGIICSNEEAISKQIAKMETNAKLGLPYYMAIELSAGSTIHDPIKRIDLAPESVTDLVNIDMRKEILREVLALWGVTPIYSADMRDVGGLNAETMQLKVLAGTTLAHQEHYHETEFPWVMECIGVDDWVLRLNPPQEENSIDKERVVSARLDNAEKYRRMGLTLELEDAKEGEFSVSGEVKEFKEVGGFGGFGNRNDFFDDTPGEEDNIEEMDKSFDFFKAKDPEWQINDDILNKAFEQKQYSGMSIVLSEDINKEISKGLRANAGFSDIVKNIEDLPQWQTHVQSANPALGLDGALDVERYRIEGIVNNEGTKLRKEAYRSNMKERDPNNRNRYRWGGASPCNPDDERCRMSWQCNRIVEMIDEVGGDVTMPEFESIMVKAVNDLIREGRIHRSQSRFVDVNSHQPHLRCRRRLARTR